MFQQINQKLYFTSNFLIANEISEENKYAYTKSALPRRSKCREICFSLTITYSSSSVLEACSICLGKSRNESHILHIQSYTVSLVLLLPQERESKATVRKSNHFPSPVFRGEFIYLGKFAYLGNLFLLSIRRIKVRN